MTTSVTELLSQVTQAQALTTLLQFLQIAGFPATSWQSGSLPFTLLQSESQSISDLSAAIVNVAKGGYSDTATGGWADILGWSLFREYRKPAVFTQGAVTMTDVSGGGPVALTAGQIWVSDGATKTFKYNSIAAASIPLNGSASVLFQAESAGAAYNLGNGTITNLVTSLPGVSITNPASATLLTWITQQGADIETDANYMARCVNKWATLGTGLAGGYKYYATTTSNEVTRVKTIENTTNGSVTVVIGGSNGPISSTAKAAVTAVLTTTARPLCVTVNVVDVTLSQTPITGTVFVSASADLVATRIAVQNAISALAQIVDIGGIIYTDTIIAAAMGVPGVYNFSLSAPNLAGGVLITQLAPTAVFSPVFSLTASR